MSKETLEFEVDGKPVLVDTLPKPIRDTVAFFDKVNADIEEAAHIYNTLIMAAKAIKSQIMYDTAEFLKNDENFISGEPNDE